MLNKESAAPGWCLVSPLPAVVIGIAVMALADVPGTVWLRNVAATGLGLLVVTPAYLRRGTQEGLPPDYAKWIAAGSLAVLAVALVQPGVEGVRRWLPVGPLDVHAGALLLPILLVLASLFELRLSVAVALLGTTLTFLQPDASQAAAFAVGWIVLAAFKHGRMSVVPATIVGLLAVATVFRVDPLEPVNHVEGIVGLASTLGPLWSVGAVLSLLLPPLVLFTSPRRPAAVALGAYLAVTLIAAWLGHFPVPFLGYGVAPILGYYLAMLGLLHLPSSPGRNGPASTGSS